MGRRGADSIPATSRRDGGRRCRGLARVMPPSPHAGQPRPKLGPWIGELDRRLEANEKKPRRDRLSMMQIYEDLASLGYPHLAAEPVKSAADAVSLPLKGYSGSTCSFLDWFDPLSPVMV